MEYEAFRSELRKKLEKEAGSSGYDTVQYYPDGFTSEDPQELSTIRNTNIKYHKMESDILSGDFLLLLSGQKCKQVSRFSVKDMYQAFVKGGWKEVQSIIDSHLEASRKYASLGIAELMAQNEYEPLREKLFIRPLNYNDHRYELKDNVYRRIGDIVLVLYVLASDELNGEQHNVMSVKMPRKMMEQWGLPEEEVWENALTNTYIMAPPRMYLHFMDTYKPPYQRGAFMALNSDITSLSPGDVPTITTTSQMNGAIAMFYPGVKERLAELFGGDYYVAFTSIHDARLHKKGSFPPLQILRCIKETNQAFDPGEILSRKVYLYEAASKEFRQLEL